MTTEALDREDQEAIRAVSGGSNDPRRLLAEAGEDLAIISAALQDNRLVFDITGVDYTRTYALSLTPLKSVLKDYLMICDSYYEALRGSSASQIESVDMGRRGLHNEGAEQLKTRLDGKIVVDHETSRRLFTLLCALYRRG